MPANVLTAELHTAAGALPILGGSFGFDRSWAPQGQGTVRVAAAHPAAAALDPYSTTPVVLWLEIRHTAAVGIGQLPIAGPIAGMTWPAETPETYRVYDDFDDRIAPTSQAWRVRVRSIDDDARPGERTVELATAELLLIDLFNTTEHPWMPVPTAAAGRYHPAHCLQQLLAFAALPLTVASPFAVGTLAEVRPWEPGQSAWEWWDAIRVEAGTVYELDPARGHITIRPRPAFTNWVVPTVAVLERQDRIALDASSGEQQYADAVIVEWQWDEKVGTDLVRREQLDVALAPGVTDWRAARRTRKFTREQRPVPGYAQHLVNRLCHARRVTTLQRPLAPATIGTLLDYGFETIRYDLGDEPTVTATLIGD